MVIDLPAAYVGLRSASAHPARRDGTGLSGVLSELVQGRTKATLAREWRLTMAIAFRQLPPGMCLLAREGSGQELYIGPADQGMVLKSREAA